MHQTWTSEFLHLHKVTGTGIPVGYGPTGTTRTRRVGYGYGYEIKATGRVGYIFYCTRTSVLYTMYELWRMGISRKVVTITMRV
mgnify:CR=1 FL=1